MDRIAFSDRIAKLRVCKGLSQNQLALQLGLKRSVISYYESGDRLPSLDVLIKMSKVFSVTTDYLLMGNNTQRIITVSDLSEKEIDTIMSMVNTLRENKNS